MIRITHYHHYLNRELCEWSEWEGMDVAESCSGAEA